MIRYPYTDFSICNLDWCVARIQELTKEVNDFDGIRAPKNAQTGDYLKYDGHKWIAAPLPLYDGS